MHVTVATVGGKIVDEEFQAIVLPTENGQIEVLDNHAKLITAISPGVARLKKTVSDSGDRIVLYAGFAQVANGTVSVLAQKAVKVGDIDKVKVQAELDDAKDALSQHGLSPEQKEIKRLETRWFEAQLNAGDSSA